MVRHAGNQARGLVAIRCSVMVWTTVPPAFGLRGEAGMGPSRLAFIVASAAARTHPAHALHGYSGASGQEAHPARLTAVRQELPASQLNQHRRKEGCSAVARRVLRGAGGLVHESGGSIDAVHVCVGYCLAFCIARLSTCNGEHCRLVELAGDEAGALTPLLHSVSNSGKMDLCARSGSASQPAHYGVTDDDKTLVLPRGDCCHEVRTEA